MITPAHRRLALRIVREVCAPYQRTPAAVLSVAAMLADEASRPCRGCGSCKRRA